MPLEFKRLRVMAFPDGDDTTFTLALTQFQHWTERMTDKQTDIHDITTSRCVCLCILTHDKTGLSE